MNLNKKLSFSLATFSVLSILASCSSGNLPSTASINGSSDFSKSAISSNVRVVSDNISKEHIIIDAGNGIKTNASFTVQVNLDNGFKTKANVNGTAQGKIGNLASIQFWLLDSPTLPPTTTASSVSSFTSTLVTGTTHIVTFINVPDNTTPGNEYYIAAAGFTTAAPASGSNITNLSATASDTTLGKAYISSSGVSVSGEQVNSPTSLTIGLTLLDAVGAKIDGNTTVTDGAALPTGGVTGSAT